jgi:hypothetical protein
MRSVVFAAQAPPDRRHQPLVPPTLVLEHPEPDPPLLILGDTPKARGGAIIALLHERARDPRDAVDLRTAIVRGDGGCKSLGEALQGQARLAAIQREVTEAVQRVRELMREVVGTGERYDLFQKALPLDDVAAIAKRLPEEVQLVDPLRLVAGLLK